LAVTINALNAFEYVMNVEAVVLHRGIAS
jgi:hypothetical protein